MFLDNSLDMVGYLDDCLLAIEYYMAAISLFFSTVSVTDPNDYEAREEPGLWGRYSL
jgi:hypothetical protein